MAFKVCVLLITIFLCQNGQTFRIIDNSYDEINESTVKMMQEIFIKKYPQVAIDKYFRVVRQLFSKVPEEQMEGKFEAFVLVVEGALYRTKMQREMLGNSRCYDVRSALKRIEETADVDDEDESYEKVWEATKNALDKEFPSEVVQIIMTIISRVHTDISLEEATKAVIDLAFLSMDGARVVTSKWIPTNAAMCVTFNSWIVMTIVMFWSVTIYE